MLNDWLPSWLASFIDLTNIGYSILISSIFRFGHHQASTKYVRQHLTKCGRVVVFLKTVGRLDIYAKTNYRKLNSNEFNKRAIL
ncbi:hypothetical protein AO843_12575 [Lysinibacillus sp. ZYM-1]|nr:hypothetical protein AO843_12575 [Lysinibacillus sp. ZYM-1]